VTRKLAGIFPAVPAVFGQKEEFLEGEYARLIASLYEAEVDGVYVCGMNGSGHRMRIEERMLAAEVAAEVSRRFRGMLIVHIGSSSSRDTMQLAEHAARAGADALAAIPPANIAHPQVVGYYRDIAAASGLPLLIYHFPAQTHYHPTLAQMGELLACGRAAGLKFTDWNLFLLRRLRLAFPEIIVLNGYDQVLLPSLLYGADGGIGSWYNVFPRLFVSLYRLHRSGAHEQALELQIRALSLLDWTAGFPREPVFERALRLRGFGPRFFRQPRAELDQETETRVAAQLEAKMAALDESFATPAIRPF